MNSVGRDRGTVREKVLGRETHMAPKNRFIHLLLVPALLGLLPGCGGDGDRQGPGSSPGGCTVDPSSYDGGTPVAFDPLAVPEERALFPLPVQAGAMTEDEVYLTAYAEGLPEVKLMVWRDADRPNEIVLVRDEELASASGFYKVRVDGLAPNTAYHYAFFALEGETAVGRSVVGTFRTAPPPDCAQPVVVAGTHGTNREHQPFTALQITARYDLDVFVQLGDYSYNDDGETLEEYRDLWASTQDDPGYWALLPSVGQYIVWDDHEFRDNSSYYADMGTEAFEAAKEAFFERNPVPRLDHGSYWTSYRWGKTAEFFALDCRSERVYRVPELQFGGLRYISPEQMAWLKEALLESPCHFKVILNSVPITNFPPPWDIAASDRWEGFPGQRAELLDFITDNGIEHVWFLSGDFHTGAVAKVETTPPRDEIREVLMGPAGNLGNPAWYVYDTLGMHDFIAPVDQFDFFYGLPTATIMTFDPTDDSVRIVFIDAETEEVLYDRTLY